MHAANYDHPDARLPTDSPVRPIDTHHTQSSLLARRRQLPGTRETHGFLIGEYLASGNVSQVFRATKDGRQYVFKMLSPGFVPRLVYRALRHNGHGYRRTSALLACYWRRRMVSRLVGLLRSDVEICDAIAVNVEYHGFFSPYIESPRATSTQDKQRVRLSMMELSTAFRALGLPTWAFDPAYPFWFKRSENVRIDERMLTIIDYESGIPLPVPGQRWDLDHVDFGRVDAFIRDHEARLAAPVRAELREAFSNCLQHTQAWHLGENRTMPPMRARPTSTDDARPVHDNADSTTDAEEF